MFKLKASVLLVLCFSIEVFAHEGPDPISHWNFNTRNIDGQTLKATLGPDATITGNVKMVQDPLGESLLLSGIGSVCTVVNYINADAKYLPKQAMTVAAWVSIDAPQEWGGIIGTIQDNGNVESGWVLGYNNDTFTFALASTGADDGDGLITYLAAKTKYELGRMYHVVGVYDGQEMQIFVNGKLEGSSDIQSGDILYPQQAPYVMAAYRDSNEFHSHQGRVREISVYDLAAKAAWVEEEFKHNSQVAALPAVVEETPLDFLVTPYLQFVTQESITVMWRSSRKSEGSVYYGETAECTSEVSGDGENLIHEIKLEGLKPETQYFYRIESKTASGEKLTSEVATFQTAVKQDTPYAFAVISDTQGNPTVSKQLAEMAWAQRPSFLLHPGDLVSTGTNDSHWTQHFFPGMQPLIRHVAFFPVLGNHEQNAKNYYDYVSLPTPEYYYQFKFGNTDFFMIDTNRNVQPGSEQYIWLDKKLSESTATWKVVCHHHPPYSSDENDYGNLWKTNKSSRGDTRARVLTTLYEKYSVDVVWNGHIHSYERTWPVKENKAVERDAPFYMITGGGGGGLETPGPFRPYFQNNVRRGHHYVMVYVNGKTFELKSFTLEGRLFDYLKVEK
ncbi:MAG: metallophosphoesterase [Pirellulales bacterium]